MTTDRIPPEIEALLRDRVKTFEQLEVLLLLGRDPEREWSFDAILSKLRWSAAAGSETIEYLRATGVLTAVERASGERFRCHPESARVLQSLVAVYDESRTDLMKLMTKLALDRVRTSALRAFSSAFDLRRRNDG